MYGSSDSNDLTIWRGDSRQDLASSLDGPFGGEGEIGVIDGGSMGFREESPRYSSRIGGKIPQTNNGVTQPIPEPATVWLIGTGLLLLGGGLRRRSSS
jgi:hypothetical protein